LQARPVDWGLKNAALCNLRAFSPKRFNRFPRFSAIIKGAVQNNLHEKTVNLNSEVLGFLHSAVPVLPDETYLSYDPFDRVLLVKEIDNQILTSFRTLKGENNVITET